MLADCVKTAAKAAPPQKEIFVWMKELQASVEAQERLTKATDKSNVIDEALSVVPQSNDFEDSKYAKSEIVQVPPMNGTDAGFAPETEHQYSQPGSEQPKPQESAYGLAPSNSEYGIPNTAPEKDRNDF